MSKVIKPLLFVLSATFATIASLPAHADAGTPMARETHADVRKDKGDMHKDAAELRAALRDRARDRHALAVARREHHEADVAKAEADLKMDNIKIHHLQSDLRKDRKDLRKDSHHMAAKHEAHPMAEKHEAK